MGELIRRLIRWIIFIIIIVLLILLIVKLANKNNTASKTKKVLDSGVQTIKKETKKIKKDSSKQTTQEETKETPKEEVVTSTLIVDAPDTGSSMEVTGIILGIIVVSSGIYYIIKNRNLVTE